jgi:hypothetical protein
MRIRLLGSKAPFRELDDDDCAWCEAAYRWFVRQPHLSPGDSVHLENEKGRRRTVSLRKLDPMVLECEPYVFFRLDDDDDDDDDDG